MRGRIAMSLRLMSVRGGERAALRRGWIPERRLPAEDARKGGAWAEALDRYNVSQRMCIRRSPFCPVWAQFWAQSAVSS